MQSATGQIVDQRLVVCRKRRRRRQSDLGCLGPQRIGLSANSQQLLGLGIPGPHFVVADRPGIRHGGIAGVEEILPRSEIASEESLADHAVERRRPARSAADERHEPLWEASADVFDLVGRAPASRQGVVVGLRGTGRQRLDQFRHRSANRPRRPGQRRAPLLDEQHPAARPRQSVAQHPAAHAGADDNHVPHDVFRLARQSVRCQPGSNSSASWSQANFRTPSL